ncbi:hypothetical protein WN944_009437 [Citrus x changshan-huyou]|uniref:Uncharacterized protein n=1 Tax=Citrus x changshan-huyou TaxID=2935761 RepID=A0AAP0MUJ2_9ROSI
MLMRDSGCLLYTTRISARSTLPRSGSLLVKLLLQKFLRTQKQVRVRRLFSRRKPSDAQVRNEGLPFIRARYPPTSRKWMLHFRSRGWLRGLRALILGLESTPRQLSLTGIFPAPAPPATRLLQDIPARGTLLPDVYSSLLVFVEALVEQQLQDGQLPFGSLQVGWHHLQFRWKHNRAKIIMPISMKYKPNAKKQNLRTILSASNFDQETLMQFRPSRLDIEN